MSLEFLSPASTALSRSPMERQAVATGARLERRDGWNVAAGFDGSERERERCRSSVGFADLSHLGKVEVQASAADLVRIAGSRAGGPLELGRAIRTTSAWWCPFTPERAIVLCDTAALPDHRAMLEEAAADCDEPASVVNVTTAFAALAIVGPLARETFARFSAVDLRAQTTPPGGFRPGSVARTPGAVLREADERFVMLFGAALGQYMWTVVADAAASLGGGPVGVDVLDPVEAPRAEVTAGA
jgi:glycine cleavage system aminomethyltransferase T